MTRLSSDFSCMMQKSTISVVSADVHFASSHFPSYRIGADDQIVDVKDDPNVLSMKDLVAQETAMMLEQQKRLSVRDLTSKFEKGLVAAAKLSDEARLKEAVSLEKQVVLKKLRDALEALRGRVAGKNRDDVEEAVVMVETLAVQLTQREEELSQGKVEMMRLVTFLEQASEDAKKRVHEERAFALAEIENARAAVHRVEQALQEHEKWFRASGLQDMEELMKEVQEDRRVKMLHQPSRVMDMELELQALRILVAEKSKQSLQLQKEVARSKNGNRNMPQLFNIDGDEALGSCLRICPCSDSAPDLSDCTIQWYRCTSQGDKKKAISGATKSVYAPETFDVGRRLQADISTDDQTFTVMTAASIDPGSIVFTLCSSSFMELHFLENRTGSFFFFCATAGLGNDVEALARRHDAEFIVVIIQMNGVDHPSQSFHKLHIGKMRMKLGKGKTTIAKEFYSYSMQLCGVRGSGNAAGQAVYWRAKVGLSFVPAFESERERNAALMLARRFGFDRNITLAGPNETSSAGN